MENMGLPPGALEMARHLEEGMAKLKEIEAIARRICADFGLNFSDPSRGLEARVTPSVQNPVQLKLPSLQDLDIRDAQDGDLLTFDGARGKWVARRHDTVQLPKEFPQGDPDSYYVEPVEEEPETGMWSSTAAHTNYILDPSFETGATGWFIPDGQYAPGQSFSVAKSVSHAPGAGIGGGDAIKIITSGTVDIMELNYAFYELPSTPRNAFMTVQVRCDTPLDSTHEVYASIINYDADGNYLDETNITSTYVGMTQGWRKMYVGATPWQDAFNPPGVRRYLMIRIGSNYNQPWLENAEIYVDQVSLSDTQEYFDGDTTDTPEYAYVWSGEPNNSTSIATVLQQIQVPETITLGEPFTVNGRGWLPGATVDVYEEDWYAANSLATVEPDGTFTTTLTLPANTDPDVGPVAGPGIISATREGAEWSSYSPYVNVTFI